MSAMGEKGGAVSLSEPANDLHVDRRLSGVRRIRKERTLVARKEVTVRLVQQRHCTRGECFEEAQAS